MTAPLNLEFFEVDPTLEGTRVQSNLFYLKYCFLALENYGREIPQ